MKPIQIEGINHFDWVLMDYFDTVVHIFRKETRDLYNLEQLWEINFESEKNKLAY